MSSFETQVLQGERFEFGKNWQRFLTTLNEERIEFAEQSLLKMLGGVSLRGKTFLDVGSGSGLSSLCARRLGATVHSFDYDPHSVACTNELRKRYFPNDEQWTVERGSALDAEYLAGLGQFDFVYSWGVLHHTGDMWKAIGLVTPLVQPDGHFLIAIYNDQGGRSCRWKKVKKLYCSGWFGKALVSAVFIPYYFARVCLSSLVKRRNTFAEYRRYRGMSPYHDWHDWLGGYPFEVARVEELFHFYRERGFNLLNLRTTDTIGCNELLLINSNLVPTPVND